MVTVTKRDITRLIKQSPREKGKLRMEKLNEYKNEPTLKDLAAATDRARYDVAIKRRLLRLAEHKLDRTRAAHAIKLYASLDQGESI